MAPPTSIPQPPFASYADPSSGRTLPPWFPTLFKTDYETGDTAVDAIFDDNSLTARRMVIEAMRAVRRDWARDGHGTGEHHRFQVMSDVGVAVINGSNTVHGRFGRTAENRRDILWTFRDFEEKLHGIDPTLPGNFAAVYDADDDAGSAS